MAQTRRNSKKNGKKNGKKIVKKLQISQKKLGKLVMKIQKCQSKHCKQHKWGQKNFRDCTQKNCKKIMEQFNKLKHYEIKSK